MEFNSVNKREDTSAPSDPVQPETSLSGDRKHNSSTIEENKVEDDADMDSGDVNMEASISADDVMRAGGFGARDDISSFLPVASDSTDFEASLRDAREYEEPQKDVCRPGLGWKDDVNKQG
ncbi:hypothetical protein R6Q59_025658 [Mikania micrantha]|uniref:Uncharacterized protein n=1 Tax=Mikania micrantha TaxID=192012 RepID=A0A5N6PC85_9ASTR|nr:hypothetical protein E3N88_10904 [Mikania micrantha]KAD6119659.1 hypothetical protein E3N88_10930 [Mikania micrantha]